MASIVRVLVVTEDWPNVVTGGFLQWHDQPLPAARTPTSTREFHLGEFVRVLEETAWVGFTLELTKALRPSNSAKSDAALKAERGADVVNFRFDQPFTVNGAARKLADYDAVLFFGMNPMNPDASLSAEADAIAQFMEQGGGFFATGDHENLGSALPGLIPRVRSMRRWYFTGNHSSESPVGPNGEAPAPPALGSHRHDTTRPGLDGLVQFEDQSDEVPQAISPTLYAAGFTIAQGYPARRYLPHPLLCSPDGVVSYLPDHMHEGRCDVPDNLATRTFTLAGVPNVREYPDYTPPDAPPGFVPGALAPDIVATGSVVAGTKTPVLDGQHIGEPKAAAAPTTFGVIGAWDGHRVDRGRVVVDSTFHHFFNINLTGDRYLEDENLPAQHQQKLHGFYVLDGNGQRVPNDAYRMIMWYFRNIVYWLIPAKRMESIAWSAFEDFTRSPQLREELPNFAFDQMEHLELGHYVYFGQLAERYFKRARGACAVLDIQRILFKPKIPWWEWIQNVVDVWDPAQKERDHQERANEQWVGTVGLGPRPDTLTTLSLGVAVVTSAGVQRKLDGDASPRRRLELASAALPSVLRHAGARLTAQLKLGAHAHRRLEAMTAGLTGRKSV